MQWPSSKAWAHYAQSANLTHQEKNVNESSILPLLSLHDVVTGRCLSLAPLLEILAQCV